MKDSDDIIIKMLFNKTSQNQGMKLLMDQYSKELYPVINAILRDPNDTFDVLQEVYIKVFAKIKKFNGASTLFTWIYRIAVNEALQHLRKKKKKAAVQPLHLVEDNSTFEPGESEETILEKLNKAIQQLPERQQLVFTLRYFKEMDYKTMSKTLNTSEGSLKASYHHAIKKIEKHLINS